MRLGAISPLCPISTAKAALLPALLHKVLLKDAMSWWWEKPISGEVQEGETTSCHPQTQEKPQSALSCPRQLLSPLDNPQSTAQLCLWVPCPRAEHLPSSDLAPIRKPLAQEDNKCVKVYKHRPPGNHKNHFPVCVLKYYQRGVKKEEGWRPPVPHTLQHKICEQEVKEPCPCLGCLEKGQGED